jgi:catechol 2,3-dioxygenase-like lactoylglutathione lyase family enzyme
MRDYRYDHVHLRSPDPDATARFFETMFGAEVTRGVYPPGTLYPGQQRITMRLGRPDRADRAVPPARA